MAQYKYCFDAKADSRKVKSVLNRTILVCRRARLFDLAKQIVQAKKNLKRV